MIELEIYKIVIGIYDTKKYYKYEIEEGGGGKEIFLRGHPFTLEHEQIYTANRSNFFVNRVVKNGIF